MAKKTHVGSSVEARSIMVTSRPHLIDNNPIDAILGTAPIAKTLRRCSVHTHSLVWCVSQCSGCRVIGDTDSKLDGLPSGERLSSMPIIMFTHILTAHADLITGSTCHRVPT